MLDTKHKEGDQNRFKYPNMVTFSSPSEQLKAKGILIFYNKSLIPTFNEIVKGQLIEMNFTLKGKQDQRSIAGPKSKSWK